MRNIKKITFEIKGDNRGSLVALEQFKEIPFDIKRVYYIFDTKHDIARGSHAHKNLEQVLICVNGSCKIKLDDGNIQQIIELNYPDQGLYIGNDIWREMFDFSQGCVLLVVANDSYDEKEYIKDYNEFIKGIN